MHARHWCGAAAAIVLALPAVAADQHVPAEFATIQAAIDAASPGDNVLVAAGVYTGVGNVDLDFLGKAITVRGVDGPDTCIIDCDATPERPARGVHFISGETSSSVFEGFTIKNGATLPGAIADPFNGAAILCNNSSNPTIRNVVCRDNHAGCWGGAICCSNASPTIIDCTLTNNLTDDDGGGLFAWGSSSPVVINTLIVDNHSLITAGGLADFTGGEFGFTLINCTIAGNTAVWNGGAGYVFSSNLVNCVVWGNESDNGDDNLSGIHGSNVSYSCVAGGADGEGNIDGDPQFVDPDAGNYHLGPASACRDAGDSRAAIAPFDFDGQPRIMGSAVDMGMDERPSADLDGDGLVGGADLAMLLSNWGPCGLCAADLDEDGTIGSADLSALLAAWGL